MSSIESIVTSVLWVLITVTNNGTIHQESGFQNRALCEDAISIARYGKTVAEYKEDERMAREKRQKSDNEWRAAHPPREPKTAIEKSEVKSEKLWAGSDGCGHTENGLIYDDPPTCFSMGPSWSPHAGDNEIKYARCLPEPPEDEP